MRRHVGSVQASILAVVLAVLVPASHALAEDGITSVKRSTGTDAASVARRVQALEERIDSLWSLRQGPDILSVDTLDRVSTRLLGAEARLAAMEQGASGPTQALQVSTSLLLLSSSDLPALVQGARRGSSAELSQLRYLAVLVKLTPWPDPLKPKAVAMGDALTTVLKAISRGEAGEAERLARSAEATRQQLAMSALAWTASAKAGQSGHGHMDHSPRHGGLLGMRGDLHIEVVASAQAGGGAFSVFLSDAFRAPLRTDGVSGDVVLWPDSPRAVTLPLSARGERLDASGPAGPGTEPLDLRVRLDGTPSGKVEMDFQVPGVTPAP